MKHFFFSFLILLLTTTVRAQQWHAYVFIAEECPVCNFMGKPLNEISKKYESQVTFHLVFPLKNSNYKTVHLFKEKYSLQSFESLLDKDLAITKKLGASVTPEVVITDEFGNVHYRGRINSAYYAPGKMKHGSIQHDLDVALATLLNGKEIVQPWPPAIGCYITMYASN